MAIRLRFTKMHGLGNDFVVIDGINQPIELTPERVRKLSDRRFGIGCDQVLVVEPPSRSDNDFRYRIFNHDGSEVENCGNGARCFAKFVRDKKLTGKRTIKVETLGGDIVLHVSQEGSITVDMGLPILAPQDIPFIATGEANHYPITVEATTMTVGAVSMGNPHVVTIVDDIETAPVDTLGPSLESHERFPQRVNVGFMAIIDRNNVNLRVYERGAGETLACGTGACAAVVAGRQQHLLDALVTVTLPGGTLKIEWQGKGHPVLMTGPAANVFQGQVKL